MVKEANYKKSTLIEILLYLGILAFVFAVPLFVGLSLSGFEESFVGGKPLEFGSYLSNFLTYTPFLIVAFLNIIFPIAKLITLKPKQHPATTPNPAWHRILTVSYLHSPEENGLIYQLFRDSGYSENKNPARFMKNPLRLFLYSFLIFGIYGLFLIGNPQIAIAGVPQLQLQQVTLASEVTFGALVPAFAENGLWFFIFMLLAGIVAYLLAKYNNKNIYAYYGLMFLVGIIMMILWASFHSIVYGADDASYTASLVFGGLMAIFTILTGSFIPAFVLHTLNNAFILLSKAITLKEDLFLVSILIYIVILGLTIGIGIRKKNRNKVVNGIPS